ncbi:MAG: hypothetical protein IPN76_13840 [Saprospiraceae bacterium]|jgi:hypothetical protein|nr:hypothetical protein [Saprospiraceae bacterium]
MKNTVSQLKLCFFVLAFFSVSILTYAQRQINFIIDPYLIFTKPASANSAHSFNLGGGPGVALSVGNKMGSKFNLSGGIVMNMLWFKETGIQVNWGTGKTSYDRKFQLLEYGFSGNVSKKIGNEKFSISPQVGLSYTWFNGSEKFKITEGSGEEIGDEKGNFGSSLNLHGGLGFSRSLSNGRRISMRLVYAHHLGSLETKTPELFGTPSFQLHTFKVNLGLLGLFSKKKTATTSN